MGIFHSIKKSRRVSSDIDEKIEYLNKELVKTGLHEMMTTDKVYQSGNETTNTDFNNFQGLSVNGLKLGISGADGNGAGDAYVGTIETGMRLAGGYVGLKGAAISPPHPVTGVRNVATTQTGFAGFFSPLLPGQIQRSGNTPSGGALWYWDPNHNNGEGVPQGQWFNLEWVPSQNAWAHWDENFLGFFYLNTNLDDLVLSGNNIGTEIKNKIAGINFGSNGSIGTPKTLVLTQNKLDDVGFLPINIDGLSTQGFKYLSRESRRDRDEKMRFRPPTTYVNLGGGAYPLTGRTKTFTSGSGKVRLPTDTEGERRLAGRTEYRTAPGEPIYVDGSSEPTTSTQTQQQPSSSQTQQSPPSSDFDPNLELTPDNIPDEFKADDSKKPSAKGVKLTKWMSRSDFMKKYPGSTMVEYLSALPYGGTNFMKPDPNFPRARNVDTAAYERYFMTGDTTGVSGKPKHSKATPEPEEKKWGGKTKEQIIADLEADSAKYSAEEKAAKAEMQRIALELGMDFVSLIGGLFTGGTTAAPVLGKLGVQLSKKYGKSVAGKMFRKLLKKFRNSKNNKELDDLVDFIDDGGGFDLPKTKTSPKTSPKNRPPKPKDKIPNDMEYYWNKNDGEWRVRSRQTYRDYGGGHGHAGKGADGNYVTFGYKPDGKLLSEAAKLGHFEPEVLNVDIEQLRKGIMPEFPKDPPPEMINGYSAKSKLAPKTIEGEPFLNITKKDLAKNHRFTDKEISEYMDEINAINDYIRKNPAELKYAMIRYPKDDPRLAQLNFKMDQMKAASDEYMETHFPENQKLFNKLQQKIFNTIGQTDPKNFKDHTSPPQFTDESKINEQRKRIVSKHFKKSVRIKKLFRG